MPKTLAITHRNAAKQLREWALWLIENAKAEATEHELMLISFVRPNKKGLITVAESEMLNLILFDKTEVKIDYKNGQDTFIESSMQLQKKENGFLEKQ